MTTPGLPLFFGKVTGLTPEQHAGLRLDRSVGYGFAAGAASIPIGLAEFPLAARHYPIVFAAGAVPSALAVVGLDERGNLFVEPDGSWRKGAYIPAYVRAFPFILAEDRAKQATFVAMEEGAACLGTGLGEALFEAGQPTQVLREAVQFCAALREALDASGALARALDEAGVLREEEANVQFAAGGAARVRGFRVIGGDALDRVGDETFLDWRRRGWLAAVYAQMHAAGNWARLVDAAASRT